MQIYGINNCPNFQARIKVNKVGLQNLTKDIADTTKIGTHGSASLSSTVVETTALPVDSVCANNCVSDCITMHSDAIDELNKAISARNIKTLESENTKATLEASGIASSGVSSTASGMGGYVASAASALDQSAHYPNLLYPESVYDSIIEHSPKSSADFVESITYRTYDSLYDKRASAGNELASSDSSFMLGLGYLSNIIGSTLLKDGKAGAKKLLDGPKKNIPS
jgi:hypothetical protein